MTFAGIIGSLRRLAQRDTGVFAAPGGKLDAPPLNPTHRLEALEKAVEVQAALNETVTFQLKVVCDLLEKLRKRLFAMTLGLIATATVAAIALAAAMLS